MTLHHHHNSPKDIFHYSLFSLQIPKELRYIIENYYIGILTDSNIHNAVLEWCDHSDKDRVMNPAWIQYGIYQIGILHESQT